MTDNKKAGFPVPGWNPGLGTRFGTVIEYLGGLTRAAEIAGVNPDQVARWRDGKSKASFHGVHQLCEAAGLRLDWLATGKEPAAATPHPSAEGIRTDTLPLLSEEELVDREVLLMVLTATLANDYADKSPREAAGRVLRRYETVNSIKRHLQRKGVLDPQVWAEILELAGIKPPPISGAVT